MPGGDVRGVLTDKPIILTGFDMPYYFTGDGPKVADLRLYLKNGEQTLSETWLFQFHIG